MSTIVEDFSRTHRPLAGASPALSPAVEREELSSPLKREPLRDRVELKHKGEGASVRQLLHVAREGLGEPSTPLALGSVNLDSLARLHDLSAPPAQDQEQNVRELLQSIHESPDDFSGHFPTHVG